MPTGGQVLVKALKNHGVEKVFCVAGESYLPVLDALLDYPEIEVITCRQESGATFAAESYALLTGKPGIAMVTRGPGACNGSIGVHTAKQSSAPMITFIGQINSKDTGKEAFQEFDLPQMFDSHTKWSADIPLAEEVADYVTKAFHVALSDRMGPVVLGLPEEVLKNDAPEVEITPKDVAVNTPDDMSAAIEILQAAERPVVLVGGSDWRDDACAALQVFAEKTDLPITVSLRRQDVFNHNHKNYVGDVGFGPNPELVKTIKAADVILVLGSRLNEIATQEYSLFEEGQKLIHIHPSSDEFNKVYKTDVNVQSHMIPALEVLGNIDGSAWSSWTSDARKIYETWTDIPSTRQSDWNGADMTQVFRQLRNFLPEDAVVTTDAGNFSGWAQRYLRYGRPGHLLAPVSGAMGYAVPSAVAASLTHPDRVVLGLCGDGGFMMTGQEIATAIHHNAAPIIMVCNNAMYGTIRMHQERDYPGRVSATDLTNPDFIKLAESYGAFAARVNHEDEFEEVWKQAVDSKVVSLIEITMDPRQISTVSKL